MNRSDRVTLLAIALLICLPMSVVAYENYLMPPRVVYVTTTVIDGITYTGSVSATWKHADGTIYAQSLATENTLTNLGKDLIKTLLSSSSSTGVNTVKYIQITNATFTASATSTYCCGTEHVTPENSYGLSPQAGTYASTGTGTWTVTATFTLDVTPASTQTIYGAALTTSVTIGAGAANDFAESLFGTTAPLSIIGDNVQVQWSLTAAEA